MILKSCVVCQHDITGWGNTWTCSQLCRDLARREKRARKKKRRSAAYRQRHQARQLERARAKRAADPAWQAWRAAIEARKRHRQELERTGIAEARRELHKIYMALGKLRKLARRLRRFKPPVPSRHSADPEERRAYYRRDRLQQMQTNPNYYPGRRERRRRANAPIAALRELGWLDDGLTVLATDEQIKAARQKKLDVEQQRRAKKIRCAQKLLKLDIVDAHRRYYQPVRNRWLGPNQLIDRLVELTGLACPYIHQLMRDGRSPRHVHSLKWSPMRIIVDRNGTAIVVRHIGARRDSEAKNSRDRQQRTRARALLAALHQLGWLRNGQVVPPEGVAA